MAVILFEFTLFSNLAIYERCGLSRVIDENELIDDLSLNVLLRPGIGVDDHYAST